MRNDGIEPHTLREQLYRLFLVHLDFNDITRCLVDNEGVEPSVPLSLTTDLQSALAPYEYNHPE